MDYFSTGIISSPSIIVDELLRVGIGEIKKFV